MDEAPCRISKKYNTSFLFIFDLGKNMWSLVFMGRELDIVNIIPLLDLSENLRSSVGVLE